MTAHWNLTELLGHETGDSWNGTHGRIIQLHRRGDDWIMVKSINALTKDEEISSFYSRDDMRIQAPMAVAAKYFSDFAAELRYMAPDFYSPLQAFDAMRQKYNATDGKADGFHGRRFFFGQDIACAQIRDDDEFSIGQIPTGPLFQDEDYWKRSYLHMVAIHSKKSHAGTMIRAFLKAGVPLDMKDMSDATALHEAACCDNVPAAQALIEAGSDIAARTVNGVTPLEIAVATASPEMVSILLSAAEEKMKIADLRDLAALARRRHALLAETNPAQSDVSSKVLWVVWDCLGKAEKKIFQRKVSLLDGIAKRRPSGP